MKERVLLRGVSVPMLMYLLAVVEFQIPRQNASEARCKGTLNLLHWEGYRSDVVVKEREGGRVRARGSHGECTIEGRYVLHFLADELQCEK